MSQTFAAIAVRSNGQDVDAGWWNILRLAGVFVESFLGAGFISPTTFAIANNQSAAANVTGLLFSSSVTRSTTIEMQARRVTTGGGAVEVVERFVYFATYNTLATSWTLTPGFSGGDNSGMVFSITSGGQVQYTSDNMSAGSYDAANSLLTFSARTLA